MVEVEYKDGEFKLIRDFRVENGDSFAIAQYNYWLVISCHTNIVTITSVISDEKLVTKAIIESDYWIINDKL